MPLPFLGYKSIASIYEPVRRRPRSKSHTVHGLQAMDSVLAFKRVQVQDGRTVALYGLMKK